MRLPAGYARVTAAGAEAFAWREAAGWLEEALAEAGDLASWAAERPDVRRLAGRAPVLVLAAPARGPDGRELWAVRRYVRGGAARALGDRYVALGTPRPLRELATSVEARARGVPTPAVVAGTVRRSGALYRAELVTELVPRARSLSAVLFAEADVPPTVAGRDATDRAPATARRDAATRSTALRLAGRLVRSLAEAGVRHRDLNAHNVLIAEDAERLQAWVVDLDRCAVSKGGVGPRAMHGRLERSLRKLGAERGPALATSEWEALRSGVEDRS